MAENFLAPTAVVIFFSKLALYGFGPFHNIEEWCDSDDMVSVVFTTVVVAVVVKKPKLKVFIIVFLTILG